jgi:hypothetical protein
MLLSAFFSTSRSSQLADCISILAVKCKIGLLEVTAQKCSHAGRKYVELIKKEINSFCQLDYARVIHGLN